MGTVRCSVESLVEVGNLSSHLSKIAWADDDVILITVCNDVLIFTIKEQRLVTILQFDSTVTSVAIDEDKQRIYAVCENTGVYCTTLPWQHSVPTPSPRRTPDPILLPVPPDCIVVRDEVHSFILVEDLLVTASLREFVWSFELYEVQDVSPTAAYPKLAEFRIPAVSVLCHGASVDVEGRERPVLSCVYPSDNSSSRTQKDGCHIPLEPVLFGRLFGADVSLLRSPVILCGLPDGRLCCFPLRLPALAGPTGEVKPRVRVLHSLEQPIRFIGTSVTKEQKPQCLVVIGQRGRLLLMGAETNSEGRETGYSFSESSVPGPVLCACVDEHCLYYSTLTDLLAVPLSRNPAAGSQTLGPWSEQQPPSSQCSVRLGVSRIVALAKPSSNPTGAVQLLALSVRGRLQRVTLPQGPDPASMPKCAPTQAGQRVKDLLADIGNIWERASNLKKKLQLKNEALRHLSHVNNICASVLTYRSGEEHIGNYKRPISCHAVASWSTLLQRDSLILTCALQNNNAYTLEQGWTFCVQVQPIWHAHTATEESLTTSHSYPFQKLDPGQTLEVTVPLGPGSELCLPVRVCCSLTYSLTGLLGPEDLGASLGLVSRLLSETGCVSLALDTLTVDWLQALRMAEPTSQRNISTYNSPSDAIQVFLNSRGCQTPEQREKTLTGAYTAVIRVCAGLLRAQLKVPCPGGPALCVSVLDWLLAGGSGAGGRKPLQSPVACARCPDGCTLTLQAKEVTLSDLLPDRPLAVVEVQVESVSVAAVCGVHHAVLHRVQALLKDVVSTSECPGQLKVQRLCEAVQHAEHLYKELQEAREPAALTGVRKTRTTKTLLHLYQQLRENPLVIL